MTISSAPEVSRPIMTVDVVLLTLKEGELLCVLAPRQASPFKGVWTLPGGWVNLDKDSNTEESATRILKEKAGLTVPYLEQLQTFSGATRDSRGWSVSVAYYALVRLEDINETSVKLQLAPVESFKNLPFDHGLILNAAVDRLRSKSLYSSLPAHLMPALFTITQLQRVYETLLGAVLDKRGFRRRIDELDILELVSGVSSQDGHRPAQMYRLKNSTPNHLSTATSNLGGGA